MDEPTSQRADDNRIEAMTALRILAYAVGIIAAPFAAFCWGVQSVSWYWSFYSTIAVASTVFALSAVVFLLKKPRPLVPLSILMGWCAITAVLCYPMALRLQCGAHAIITGTTVRAIAQIGMNEIATKGQLPPSFAVYSAENSDLDRWRRRPCLCDGLSDIRVGRFSLQDFEDGRVSLEALRAEALANPPGEFERLGRITVWRNPEAWKHGLLVVWRIPDDSRWDWLNIAGADLVVRNADFMDGEEIAAEIERAGKVGVTYPDELLRLIDVYKRK